VPDLSHLWQRFVLATALVFGLALGVAATIFSYSNTTPVDIGFSVVHLRGIPLWTVAIVPVVLVLAAGTLYHWWNSLHHFTEHMRHRKRVRELESEVASLKAHLDNVLAMPDQSVARKAPAPAPATDVIEQADTLVAEEPATEPVAASNGDDKSVSAEEETEVVASAADKSTDTEPRAVTPAGA
jgi:hypothetical protein